jgi:hypothetical protein
VGGARAGVRPLQLAAAVLPRGVRIVDYPPGFGRRNEATPADPPKFT